MRAVPRLLFLLAVLLGGSSIASGAPRAVKITGANVTSFTQLSRAKPYLTCLRDGERGYLGTLSRPSVRIGAKWKLATDTSLVRLITSTKRELKRLVSRGQRWSRAYRLGQKKLLRYQAQLATQRQLRVECQQLFIGDFAGDAQSLAPYRERLSPSEVRHLLRKVAFGGSPELEAIGLREGLTALVDALVDGVGGFDAEEDIRTRAHFWASRAFYFSDEPGYEAIPIWNIEALHAGEMYRFIFTRNPFREWMVLLLSGHYAVNLNAIGFSYSTFYHVGLPEHVARVRGEALGNLRRLTKSFWLDPAMNFWLDNKDNEAGNPNQNFARELMELFILGAIDPMTHLPNYDEASVVAATAFSSGFLSTSRTDASSGEEVISIDYDPTRHESTNYRIFEGVPGADLVATLTPDGLVDHILDSHPGAPRYLAERIAGQMLYPGLSESVVTELAALLKSSDYELKPLLKRVLRSNAMFSGASRDPCVASPFERGISLARRLLTFDLSRATDQIDGSLYLLLGLRESMREAGQSIFEPPSVFGWKGSCNINRNAQLSRGEGWVSDQRMIARSRICADLLSRLSWVEYPLSDALGLTRSMGAGEILNTIASRVYDTTLSDSARTILSRYMTTEIDEEGRRTTVVPDISESYYVWRKVARAVCLIGDMIDANTQ